MVDTRMMSGFRLPYHLAERFTLLVTKRHVTLGRAYEESIKAWCDAQEGGVAASEGVKAAPVAQAVKSPAPALPVAPAAQVVRPPPAWKVYGFIHGMAHREAVANGWRPGMAIPAGLAAPATAACEVPATPACGETTGQATEAHFNGEDFA